MTKCTMRTLNSKQPGWGNEVTVMFEHEDQTVLDSNVNQYIKQYSYDGYGTRIISKYDTPTGKRVIVSRLASCD